MTEAYQTNTKVAWDWGNGTGEGYVRNVFREKTTQTIKGTDITRNGSDDDPAYLIEQSDGDKVLKLHSEVRQSSE
ncbi:DUF2945 domain-containing protein [Marinomonas gallaica]|uniref:DUF2945 domain-containing protein n=1 Tax=Marinomonas gallaica TaxID=1806667 RepID=UPI003A90C2D7